MVNVTLYYLGLGTMGGGGGGGGLSMASPQPIKMAT